ncbi:MAG: phosphoglucomutase/phosphomannomutase family protein, partial [Verrucomicrobiae bacterium]|nr:phosphoglucomutase/phosphomannomutase family protein [Verrucomicrobiae bacterium]
MEKLVDANPVRQVPLEGNVETYDPRPAHLRAVRGFVDLKKIRKARLRIVVDSMHGCGERLLEELIGDGVLTIRADRHPLFGGTNPEPIGSNLRPLCDAVKMQRAHVGLATDGDADRMGVVDDRGRYVSIQLVFALLLLHLLRNRGERGAVVVRSANCTTMIDRICRAHDIDVVEVPVGFKYICQQMRQRDVLIGGEESGGIGFRGHIPERDGLLANLMLVEMLAMTRKRLSQLTDEIQAEFGRSVYDRVDMAYPLEKRTQFIEQLKQKPPEDLVGVPITQVSTLDGVKYLARDG